MSDEYAGMKNFCGVCDARIKTIASVGGRIVWVHDDARYDPWKSPHAASPAATGA